MPIKKNRPKLDPARAEEIANYASGIGDKYFDEKSVNLGSIIEDEGIELCIESFGNEFDGMLEYVEDFFILYCNCEKGNTLDSRRGRFTIAHELGHYFIDEHRLAITQCKMPSVGDYSNDDLIIEREADLFASNLLLPQSKLNAAIKRVCNGLSGIQNIADDFNVSMKCAAIRYLSADPYPSAIALWKDGEIAWRWFSQKLWNAGYRSIKANPVPKGAIYNSIKNSSTESGQIQTSAATAEFIFDTWNSVKKDVIFSEEAIVLGEYGVLSLYWSQSELPVLADNMY